MLCNYLIIKLLMLHNPVMDVKLEEHSIFACNGWLLSYMKLIMLHNPVLDEKLEEHSILACNAWLLPYNKAINVP